MCEYCNGEKALYQETHHTKLYIDTFGKARTILTKCNPCPPYADCALKGNVACSAFVIDFCPACGEPLTEPKPLSLDELRERNGKPVWIKLYDTVTCRVLHLYKRHEMDWGGRFAFTDGSELWENQYKLTWAAYDYPPSGK